MPTLEHNGLTEMFRENPGLAPYVLATLFGVKVPAYTTVAVVEASLDQLVPAEFRADAVLELRDAAGELLLSIVLEVQRLQDADKKFTWPVYVTTFRARKRCATVVLVVAPDRAVAAWAAERIDLGLGRGSVEPFVLGPDNVPWVTTQERAEREIELAILSAVSHGNEPEGLAVVQAALEGLMALADRGRFDQEHAVAYFQVIYNALREPMQKALEVLVMERQTEGKAKFPPFAERLIERGRMEGKLDMIRRTLLKLVARAGITLSEEDRARILACTNPDVLERWTENTLGAKTAADVLS